MMYYPHNLHFLAVAHSFRGREADARKAANSLAAHVAPHVEKMPMLEGFLTVPPMVLVRFNRWDDILAAPLPGGKRDLTRAAWHYARARAHLAKGDIQKADLDRQQFLTYKKALPDDAKVSDLNTARDVLGIAETVLEAKFALAKDDRPRAVDLLTKAVKFEDALNYGEPTDWIAPVRETLGTALLAAGDAAGAEKVFRAGLVQNPRSGRCLFGLREGLKARNQDHAARLIDQQFRAAWKDADAGKLRLQDF
jgi:tetratricopeptide (TPR) repeat protein